MASTAFEKLIKVGLRISSQNLHGHLKRQIVFLNSMSLYDLGCREEVHEFVSAFLQYNDNTMNVNCFIRQ